MSHDGCLHRFLTDLNDEQDRFRAAVGAYVRVRRYRFLSQLLMFRNVELPGSTTCCTTW